MLTGSADAEVGPPGPLRSLKSVAQSLLLDKLKPEQLLNVANSILDKLSPEELQGMNLKKHIQRRDAAEREPGLLDILPDLSERLRLVKHVENSQDIGLNWNGAQRKVSSKFVDQLEDGGARELVIDITSGNFKSTDKGDCDYLSEKWCHIRLAYGGAVPAHFSFSTARLINEESWLVSLTSQSLAQLFTSISDDLKLPIV